MDMGKAYSYSSAHGTGDVEEQAGRCRRGPVNRRCGYIILVGGGATGGARVRRPVPTAIAEDEDVARKWILRKRTDR